MGPVLGREGELRQTKTWAHCQQCVKANGGGGGWEHSTTGSGQTMVRSGMGPISHPTGQPSGS
jgi:hypothetical protein